MKSIPSKLFTIFVAIAIFTLPVCYSEASQDSRENHLFGKLKDLPVGATPAPRVNKLVKKLTKLAPLKAYTFFRVGSKRFSNATGTANSNSARLANAVSNILKYSNISLRQQVAIEKKINAYLFSP